jgi:malate dehydrogenase
MRRKISVIGAGKTGATTAQRLAERNYADIVLFDVVEGLAEGEALDLLESGPILGFDSTVTGVTVKEGAGYDLLEGSALVVMTAGIARKPGMSRDDLVTTNQKIMHGWAEAIRRHCPETILIVLSNPVDAITQYAWHVTQFPRERVIGQAGILDSARFRTFLALELGVSVQNVDAYVLGSHGDLMVPLPNYTTVAGIPVTQLLSPGRLGEIVQRTRDGGAEIVKLLKTGSAFYAPSAAIVEMVDAIVLDKQKILPCTVLLRGEYGMDGVFAGVPVQLGAQGAEKIIEWKLTEEEKAALHKSAAAVQELLRVMGISEKG